MRQVVVPAPRHLAPVDQHSVQLRQPAARAGDARDRVHHQHEDAELALHGVRQAQRGRVAEREFLREALTGFGRVLVAAGLGQRERAAQQRRALAHLRAERAEQRDQPPGLLLIGFEFRCRDTALTPGEATLAGKLERVGEPIQGRGQHIGEAQQFLGRDAAIAGLDGREGLAVLEAEQARHRFLAEPQLLPLRLDPRADNSGLHDTAPIARSL